MDAKQNGKMPAFEKPEPILLASGKIVYGPQGLTKRELFAAMAMQGLLAGNAPAENKGLITIPLHAVAYADALLAELAKEDSHD